MKIRLPAAVIGGALVLLAGCGGPAPAAQTVTTTATTTGTVTATATKVVSVTIEKPTTETTTATETTTVKPKDASGLPTNLVTCAQESGIYEQLSKIYHLDTFDSDVANYSDDQLIGLGRGVGLAGVAARSLAQRFDDAQLKRAWEGVGANADDASTTLQAVRLSEGVDALVKYVKSVTSAAQACTAASA